MLLDNKSNVTEEGHNGCVPTSRRGWDCQTYTYIVNALYEAAAKGDFGEVSELIETNRRNRLYEAAAKGDVEAVSKLLETEYNMDQESQRPTPLSRTAENMEWRNRLYEAAAKENFEEKSKLLEEAAAKRKE